MFNFIGNLFKGDRVYPRTIQEAVEANQQLRELTQKFFETPMTSKQYRDESGAIPGLTLNLRKAGERLNMP